MMTIETLKKNIERALSSHKKRNHELVVRMGEKMEILLPSVRPFQSELSYYLGCVYPWCAVGYEVMNFIRANKVELKWERRQSPKTIIACDNVGSIDGRDIICYKHQGFDVGKDFLAESSVVVDDLAEFLLQHIKPPEKEV